MEKRISMEQGNLKKFRTAEHDLFLESMADAAKSVHKYFKDNIVYINVMKNNVC